MCQLLSVHLETVQEERSDTHLFLSGLGISAAFPDSLAPPMKKNIKTLNTVK